MDWDRRAALAGLGAAVVPFSPHLADASRDNRTRLILLGTAGGPRPRKRRSGSSQAIITGGRVSIIDCGDGVARQMVLAGIPLRQLRHVLVTHHHSDHNVDLGALLQLAWISGLITPVDC